MSKRPPGPPRDPVKFEDFYAEHAARVLRLVWLLGVRPAVERLDVSQEVWVVVVRRFGDVPPPEKQRAWIAKITCHRVLYWRRTKERHPELYAQEADDVPEALDGRTPETAMEEREALDAARDFVNRAIPDEDRRVAYLLHEVGGLTVEEVAEATEISFKAAQSRLRMANADLKKAMEATGEKDKEKLRAVLLPFASIEALKKALHAKVPDEDIAEVWRRVQKRIGLEGAPDSVDARPPDAPPLDRPPGYTFTGTELAIGSSGLFVGGMFAGALLLLALHWNEPSPAQVVTTETWAAPVSTERPTEPTPTSTAAPSATSAATSAFARATPAAEANALLIRVRAALSGGSAAEALALAEEHARRFPRSNAAQREECAIRALVLLGRRSDAEARAEMLVKQAPSSRAVVESILDHQTP
jgi:RNA polymerase sigma-70 factor, ECF subfamily